MRRAIRYLVLSLAALSLAVLPNFVQPAAAQKDKGLPLESDRSVRIDRTSGSWISLDVSPDGSTLAFDYLGDLFTMPIGGGDARQITSGMAFDAQPRFSPDGKQLVFTSDRDGGQNIWVMTLADSTFSQISKGASNRAESPDWMPDGTYILASMGSFRGGAQPKVKLFHKEGGAGAQLVTEPDNFKMIGAAASPDGRWVWYARRTGDFQYNAQFPQYQIEAFDRESGERFAKTTRYGSAIRPTLSQDGKWLVFGTRHDADTGLMIRDLASGDDRWLAYPVQHDDQESRATLDVLPGMSFTPDSEHLIASYGGKIWSIPVAGGAATEIPFHVSFDLELGPKVFFDYPIEDTPTFTVRQIRDGVPSPDGSRLAFTAMDRLWTAGIDGSNPARLTGDDRAEHFPVWSPDGSQIAYATWNGETGHLFATRADGRGQARQLTRDGGLYFSPAWSANSRIAALRGFVENYESIGAAGMPGQEIVWVPADQAQQPATVIAPTSRRSGPHFVEGSDRIYLQRGDALVSIRWDGTDEKEHIKVRGPKPAGSTSGLSPSVLKMAPKGDQVMAEIQRHIYTVTVPQVGRAVTVNVGDPSSASFPARRLTDIGGEFPTWGADGRTVHYALGNAHFVYSLDDADAFADSVAAAKKIKDAEEEDADDAKDDDDAESKDDDDKEDKDEGYKATEVRVVIAAERDTPQGTLVLRGATVVTMKGDEVLTNADVVVVNNRITAVGQTGSVEVPRGAEIRDVSGKTIVPGFVDAHAHLRARFGIHRTDIWPFMANLAYGVTTTRDPQTGNTEVLSYADMVRAGQVLGPRVYSTGPGVFWQDGIESEEAAKDVLSRYSDYYDTKTIKMYVAAARKGRQYIIKAARELKLMPTTEGSLNLKQNLTETIDGYPGLEHSLPIFPIYEDYKDLFVETGRVYTPTLLVSYGGPWAENYYYSRENPHDDAKLRRFTPHDEVDSRTLRRPQWFREDQHVFQRHAMFLKDLVEAGGYVGVGSHGQLQGLGYHWELWSIASGGMSNHDALRVATIFGAHAIGLAGDVGSVEVGKLADLVILDANPLDDLRNTVAINGVMINGRLHDGNTLDEVYPRQKALAPLWWWDDEPKGLPGVGR
ncbi:MAG: Tol biopolymer transport system component [Rhodothermales bacterium]|jgi:Tol biopolymer transport system component